MSTSGRLIQTTYLFVYAKGFSSTINEVKDRTSAATCESMHRHQVSHCLYEAIENQKLSTFTKKYCQFSPKKKLTACPPTKCITADGTRASELLFMLRRTEGWENGDLQQYQRSPVEIGIGYTFQNSFFRRAVQFVHCRISSESTHIPLRPLPDICVGNRGASKEFILLSSSRYCKMRAIVQQLYCKQRTYFISSKD